MPTPAGDVLVLSEADLCALADVQQALLAPLSPPLDAHLQACCHALARLVGTPHTALALKTGGVWHVTSDGAALLPDLPGTAAAPVAWRAPGLPPCTCIVHVREAEGEGALYAALPEARPGQAAGAQARMDLLAPALRAWVRSCVAQQDAAVALIGRMGEPLALYSSGGTPICHSHAFRRLLRDDPEAEAVYAEAARLAQALAPPADAAAPRAAAAQTRLLRTRHSQYELHGSRFPCALLTQPAALVHLRATRTRMPSKARLRKRLGLTSREVEVALLVAEGLTSKEIATRLNVSSNTIRRHGERVLEKLGLHARAGVAMALMREA